MPALRTLVVDERILQKLSFADAAPILCAGVTTYKGLKETNTRPREWVVISGAGGGLGHVAIQYAKAMGLHVAAVDLGPEKGGIGTKARSRDCNRCQDSRSVRRNSETNWRGAQFWSRPCRRWLSRRRSAC